MSIIQPAPIKTLIAIAVVAALLVITLMLLLFKQPDANSAAEQQKTELNTNDASIKPISARLAMSASANNATAVVLNWQQRIAELPDSAAAQALAIELENSGRDDQYQLLLALALKWGELDLLAACHFFLQSDYEQAHYLLTEIIQSHAGQSGFEIVTWLQTANLSETQFSKLQESALAGIAKAEPHTALEILKHWPQQTEAHIERMQALVLEQWASVDAPQMFEWLQANESVILSSEARTAVFMRLLDQDHEYAGRLIDAMPERSYLKSAIDALTVTKIKHDPDQAQTWIAGLQNPHLRQEAMRAYIQYKAEHAQDYRELVTFALQQDSDIAVQNLLINQVIDHVSATSFEKLAQNYAAFPVDQHGYVLERVARHWAMESPKKAQEWALSLPPGNPRDLAIASVVESGLIGKGQYYQAWALIQSIDEQALAIQKYLEMLLSVRLTAPEQYAQFYAQLELLERDKQTAIKLQLPAPAG